MKDYEYIWRDFKGVNISFSVVSWSMFVVFNLLDVIKTNNKHFFKFNEHFCFRAELQHDERRAHRSIYTIRSSYFC